MLILYSIVNLTVNFALDAVCFSPPNAIQQLAYQRFTRSIGTSDEIGRLMGRLIAFVDGVFHWKPHEAPLACSPSYFLNFSCEIEYLILFTFHFTLFARSTEIKRSPTELPIHSTATWKYLSRDFSSRCYCRCDAEHHHNRWIKNLNNVLFIRWWWCLWWIVSPCFIFLQLSLPCLTHKLTKKNK